MAIAGLAISDPDGNAGTLTTQLAVGPRYVTVASAGGAAVSDSGTGFVTLSGTLAQINTTLSASGNIVYQGVPNFNGGGLVFIVANDRCNTGSGGPLNDGDTVAITV